MVSISCSTSASRNFSLGGTWEPIAFPHFKIRDAESEQKGELDQNQLLEVFADIAYGQALVTAARKNFCDA